jgi:prepilin-type N-terminal cleavage/methylation domain-containing protein
VQVHQNTRDKNKKMKQILLTTNHKQRTTGCGFTLVELIIVMAILAIFITSLFTVFRNSLDAFKKSEARLAVYQNARAILDQMSREIQTAIFDPIRGIQAEGYEEGSGIKSDSQGDEFFFIGVVENSGDMDMVEIGYWLDNQNRIMRHFEVADKDSTPPLDFDFTTGTSNELGFNVTDLNFKFHYRDSATTWTTTNTATWNSSGDSITNYDAKGNLKNPDGLPNGVEIEITVQDPTQKEQETFSTIVYIPQAK